MSFAFTFILGQEMEESTVLVAGWNFGHVILIHVQKAKKIFGSNSALNLMANTLISMVLPLLFAGFQNTVVVSNYTSFQLTQWKCCFKQSFKTDKKPLGFSFQFLWKIAVNFFAEFLEQLPTISWRTELLMVLPVEQKPMTFVFKAYAGYLNLNLLIIKINFNRW